MKTFFTAVVSVFLVCLPHKVHPSNPDSEIVQNVSSSDVSHDQMKSAPMRMVEDKQKRSTYYQEIPWGTRSRVVGPIAVVQRFAPRTELGILSSSISYSYVYGSRFSSIPSRRISQGSSNTNGARTYGNEESGRRDQNFRSTFSNAHIPRQDVLFNSSIPVFEINKGISNFGPNQGNPELPMDSPNIPDSSLDRNAFKGNENPSSKRLLFAPFDGPNSGRRISLSSSNSNGARTSGNEKSDRRGPNFGSTISNGYIPRQNFYPSNPVFRRNESISNIVPNRENPQLPMNPPDTPDSSLNRNIFNGNENPSTKRPVFVPFDTSNPVRKISPDSNLYASIINDFGFKLIETMNLKTNFVLSPLSIFLALSMCYLGSDGTTKEQLQEMMGLKKNAVHEQKFHQGMKDLISSILPQSTNYELYLANGLFLGKNFTLKREFRENIQQFYEGKLENLDFENPQISVPVINDWVSRMTRNMIPSIGEGAPSPLTRLLVLNAIFFKGIWKTQFPPSMTFDGSFFSSDGSEKTVPTMPLYRETFPFYRSEEHGTSFLKLPYEGDQVSLIIALPMTMGENPMPSMRDEILCDVRDAFNDTKMDKVAIPKFRFDYTQSLKRVLEQLGITDMFNTYTANFNKMTPENVSVSEILQRAAIDINEQGTSASASTSLQWVGQNKKKTTDFTVNHPFAFYLIHESTGLVLFNGKIFDIGQRKGEMPYNRDSNIQGVPENTPPVNAADGVRRQSGYRG